MVYTQPSVESEVELDYAPQSVWWLLHHSTDASRRIAVITCYLDESGTDDHSPTAVVGGLLMDKNRFDSFNMVWQQLCLDKHKLPAVHMNEFGLHGKFGGLTVAERRALCQDIAEIINTHKIISLAATLTTAEYDKYLSSILNRKTMGVCGACFLLCAVTVHKLAEQQQYKQNVAYLLDNGNAYRHHVVESHKTMVDLQNREHSLHVGALGFDDDATILALQAADVISWSVRRRLAGTFPPGFEPLEAVIENAPPERIHAQLPFSEELLRLLAESLTELGDSLKTV